MENQSNSNCGCSDGCCTPAKKGILWKRIIFLVIILAAAGIVTAKLVGNQPTAKCCEKPTPACCAQPNQQTNPSCCEQPASDKK
jgi:hypothetical protein